MNYKTILAVLDHEETSADILRAASLLAQQHNAHLIGLHAVPPLTAYVSSELPVPVELSNSYDAEQKEHISVLKKMFEDQAANQSYVSEWRVVEKPPVSETASIIEISNTVDLVVLGQKDPVKSGSSTREMPERILLSTSRPVVIVPREFGARSVGSYLFMAWDGRRESSRALFDAIPAMLKADSVYLHRINSGYEDKHRIVGITEDLGNTLARHGVKLEVSHSTARTRDIGSELLQTAADKGADLIVMGAYGHSRLHELLLGGTTRQVLKDMKIPVQMSH